MLPINTDEIVYNQLLVGELPNGADKKIATVKTDLCLNSGALFAANSNRNHYRKFFPIEGGGRFTYPIRP